MDASSTQTTRQRRHIMEVQLLGSFQVKIAGRPAPETLWRSTKATALFKYLAYRVGTPVECDQVLAAVWPDLDLDADQNHLHKAVHLLRQILSAALGADARGLLEYSCGRYALWVDETHVDAVQFRRALFDARWAERLEDAAATRQLLERAAGLYNGDLLEDDKPIGWIMPERERLRHDYADTLHRLAAMSLTRSASSPTPPR